MAKRSGRRNPAAAAGGSFSVCRFLRRRRTSSPEKLVEVVPVGPQGTPPAVHNAAGAANASNWAAVEPAVAAKATKKKAGSRLWMSFDRFGRSEVVELDKNSILDRVAIPARDLRILGPVFSHSSTIVAREKAMVVNLEFIKAIITAEEILLLDPLGQDVLSFVDQLRQQFPFTGPLSGEEPKHENPQVKPSTGQHWLHANDTAEGDSELPFELHVLEIALEVVCSYLDCSVVELENDAYPVLDELAMNVSTKNLERVRSLKSHLTRLLARVQKVRDEIEHLLDDNEDMAHLYLTRKQIQNQQFEALVSAGASAGIVSVTNLARLNSNFQRSTSVVTSIYSDYNDVEDLEMLLEAYFMQLDGVRNKILSVREYIDDTEDYVNIQLDSQRNELIQLQLVLTIASFAIALNTLIAGLFAMNIPCPLYNIQNIFEPFVGGTSAGSLLIFFLMFGYARWKKLLGS